MKIQNYKNHTQMVPGFHFIAFSLLFGLAGGVANYLYRSTTENRFLAELLLLITILFFLITWYSRTFALKAQDRAIKAEEALRYYIMTGKALPTELKMGQIIALRFASDAEYLALLDRAIKEKLSNKEIKLAIQNWKADYYRV